MGSMALSVKVPPSVPSMVPQGDAHIDVFLDRFNKSQEASWLKECAMDGYEPIREISIEEMKG